MLNDQYDPPSDNEEAILDALKDGGRLRPMHISERTGKTISANNHYLHRLMAAGWVHEPESGMYELFIDPREKTSEEIAALLVDHAVSISDESHVIEMARGKPLSNTEGN